MTPREALTMLDDVAQRFAGNRQDHVNLQNAVMALNGLVLKAEEEAKAAAGEAQRRVNAGRGKDKGEE